MTIGDGNTITHTDLNTAANSRTAAAYAVRKVTSGLRVNVIKQNLLSTDAAVTRSVVFTPQSNVELRSLWIRGDGGAASSTWTLTLSVTSGDTAYLLDSTVSVSVADSGGTDQATADYNSTTATRFVLRQGVAYTLTLSSTDTGANDMVQGVATFRLERRTA